MLDPCVRPFGILFQRKELQMLFLQFILSKCMCLVKQA